jgi:hypothetical protein
MALGFNTEGRGSGDILPIVKFDAKSGDFIARKREQGSDGMWENIEEEVALPFKAVFDFAHIEVGWLSFSSGAPDFHMVKYGERMPAQPSPEHKHAFRIRIYSKALGLREFSHSSKTMLRAMDPLHNQFLADQAANPGKVPVVEVSGLETVKVNSPQGELRFKAPKWSIVSWVDKPEGMLVGIPVEAPKAAAPKPAPAPAPVAASDDEF